MQNKFLKFLNHKTHIYIYHIKFSYKNIMHLHKHSHYKSLQLSFFNDNLFIFN